MSTPPPRKSGERLQRGFALAAVLWLLAGLTIVVALVADSASTSAERVAQLRERTEFVRTALSARARVQYWLSATRPRSADFFDGAQSVQADMTPYLIGPNSVVQIQDHGGLINLNRVNRELLSRYLINCGVPQERTPYLLDALEDYTDSDDLQRINGAERDTYTAAGKPPPRNSFLLSEAEVWNVYGWDVYRKAFEDKGCTRDFTVFGEVNALGNSMNLATAPVRVLKAAGLNDDLVGDINNARQDPEKVTERAAQNSVLGGTGGLFGGMSGMQVQKVLRVTHRQTKGPWMMEYTLTLDPENEDRPWSIAQPRLGAVAGTTDKLSPLPWPSQTPGSSPSDVSRFLSF